MIHHQTKLAKHENDKNTATYDKLYQSSLGNLSSVCFHLTKGRDTLDDLKQL